MDRRCFWRLANRKRNERQTSDLNSFRAFSEQKWIKSSFFFDICSPKSKCGIEPVPGTQHSIKKMKKAKRMFKFCLIEGSV